MKIYYAAHFSSKVPFPCQDLVSILPFYTIKILPLKYNSKLFFDTDEQMKNKDSKVEYTTIFKTRKIKFCELFF